MKKNILLLSLACVEVRKENNAFFNSYKKENKTENVLTFEMGVLGIDL
jgi:hypothetical protein